MKRPGLILAVSFALACPAYGVYDQTMLVSGGDASAIASARLSFATTSGEPAKVTVLQGDATTGPTMLRVRFPTADAALEGRLEIVGSAGEAVALEVPAGAMNQRLTVDIGNGEVRVDPAELPDPDPLTSATFAEPPPAEGPVERWQRERLSAEELEALEAAVAGKSQEQLEAEAIEAGERYQLEQQGVLRETAKARAEVEKKVMESVRAQTVAGAPEITFFGSVGEDGRYEQIRIFYGDRRQPDKYEAVYDGSGNLVTPPTQTPTGKASQTGTAHKPPHSRGMTGRFAYDINMRSFISRVDYWDGGGYVLFNERGVAYQGEFFDENGNRTGAFYDPTELPRYDDPAGLLAQVALQPLAIALCAECTDAAERYNGVAREMNLIAREMNELAEEHRTTSERSVRYRLYAHSLPPIRARYEFLRDNWRAMASDLAEARDAVLECNRRCTELAVSREGFCGSRCDVMEDPFGDLLAASGVELPQSAGTAASGLYVPMQTLEAKICEGLADPAPTLVCGLTSPERLPGCDMAVPDDAEWRFGHCSATPGGEWLAEIFLRDPQMRGIDGGCEAIEPKMLPDDLDPYLRGRGYAIRSIACNQYAEDTAAAGTRIVRGHRDQIEVDTSDRRRVDYEREERRRNPSAGPSNLHLVVRDTVRDATRDSPRPVCPPKKEEDGPKDPKFAEAGANLRDFVEKGRGIVSGELPDGRVGAAIGALDALSSADQNLGAMNTRLHQANAVAQLIKLTADEIYGVQGGEKPKFADLVGGIDHVATLTGNAYMESAVKGFKVGFKVQELALKRQQGLPIETKDLKEVIEALNEFRGDRFKGLGELLDGVSKGIDKIVKVEELVKDLEGIAQLLDLAQQGRNDPQKALEAFGQYLDLLARAAGYVPGMGEFAKQYAEAVKSLQTSAATIGEAVAARNEAIRMAGEAIDGYDYDRLAQELAQFQGDVGEPPATGTALTADQVNLMAISADERQALDAATDEWSRVQDCVRTSATQLIALRGLYDGLRDEFNGLPPQAQLVDELDQAYFRAVYRDYLDKDANWRPDAAQSNRIGADSPNAALLELQSITSVQADQAINEARSRANFREWARARAKGLVDEMKATRSRLEECNKQLVALEQAYWQALRDYLAESSYWSAFVAQGRSLEAAAKARAEALAQIDQHIAARGFRIAGARIELVVATQCIEEKTVIGVGR